MENTAETKRPGELAGCDPNLIDRLLTVIEVEIIPLTREGVRNGNKIFGAAMLKKSDLSTIIAGTNHETENPLWHGEIYTINQYYEIQARGSEKRYLLLHPRALYAVFFRDHLGWVRQFLLPLQSRGFP